MAHPVLPRAASAPRAAVRAPKSSRLPLPRLLPVRLPPLRLSGGTEEQEEEEGTTMEPETTAVMAASAGVAAAAAADEEEHFEETSLEQMLEAELLGGCGLPCDDFDDDDVD